MNRGMAALCAALALCAGCRKPEGRPSPEYRDARAQWAKLLAASGEDAYERPEMAAVEAELRKVPPESGDADSAAALLAKIEGGRAQLAREREDRRRLAEGAAAGTAAAPAAGSSVFSPPPPHPAPARPALRAGLTLGELVSEYGACFEPKQKTLIASPDGGAPGEGEAWGLKDSPECRKQYAEHANDFVIVSGQSVIAVQPRSNTREVEVEQKQRVAVKAERLPDGGVRILTGADGGYLPAEQK